MKAATNETMAEVDSTGTLFKRGDWTGTWLEDNLGTDNIWVMIHFLYFPDQLFCGAW